MFDTFFYHMMRVLFSNEKYNFLKLSFYLDKFLVTKRIVENSIFTFLIPSDGIDWVIVLADINERRFVVYDPNGKGQNYEEDIRMLKKFLADYIESFGISQAKESESDQEQGLLVNF